MKGADNSIDKNSSNIYIYIFFIYFYFFAYKHDFFISKTGFLVFSKTLTVPLILMSAQEIKMQLHFVVLVIHFKSNLTRLN